MRPPRPGWWGIAAALALAGCPAEHRYPDGGGLTQQLEREVIALRQTVSSLEYQAAHCDQDMGPDVVYQELYAVYAGSQVEISRDGDVTLLTLPADFLFSGGTDLREEARMSLDLLATALRLHPEHTLTVEGHTDDRLPSGDLRRLYADNWLLSYARAEAVMVALVNQFGVAPERFTLQAKAQYEPVATNDTQAGQKKNRRVVIRIEPPRKPHIPQ